MVVETLAEKHFDLAFRMLHEFDLPGINIGFSMCSFCSFDTQNCCFFNMFRSISLLQLTYSMSALVQLLIFMLV